VNKQTSGVSVYEKKERFKKKLLVKTSIVSLLFTRSSISSRTRPCVLLPSSPRIAARRRGICPAVIELLAFACFFARDLVLFPAVDLALLVAEPRPVAGAQSKRPRWASFGLAGEAGWVGHRGRARVVFFSCGDLLLLGAVMCVDGVFEVHERE